MELGLAAAVAWPTLFAQDPLLYLTRSCEQQAELWRVGGITNCRGAYRSSKTTGGAAKGLAFSQGKRTLDGITLPPMRLPNVGALIVQSRAQQVESSQKIYLELLGDRIKDRSACRIAYLSPALDYVESIRIRPDGWDDPNPKTWSRIRIYCTASESFEGGEFDWVHADETPPWGTWTKALMRASADRPPIVWATHTPVEKALWEPFSKENWARPGYHEIVIPMVANRFLSAATKAHLLESAKGKPLERAMLLGEYVDASGSCPFDYEALEFYRGEAAEAAKFGKPERWAGDVRVQQWWDAEPGEKYWVVWDSASGIEDAEKKHSPSGMIVGARHRPAVVARLNAYMGPVELARLGARVAAHYNMATCAPEMNYSPEATMIGLGTYPNIYRDRRVDRLKGALDSRKGFWMTGQRKASLVAGLNTALCEQAFQMWSGEAVSNLAACRTDADGDLVQGPGYHTEDAICLAIYAHLLKTQPPERDEPVAYGDRGPAEWFEETFKKHEPQEWGKL